MIIWKEICNWYQLHRELYTVSFSMFEECILNFIMEGHDQKNKIFHRRFFLKKIMSCLLNSLETNLQMQSYSSRRWLLFPVKWQKSHWALNAFSQTAQPMSLQSKAIYFFCTFKKIAISSLSSTSEAITYGWRPLLSYWNRCFCKL